MSKNNCPRTQLAKDLRVKIQSGYSIQDEHPEFEWADPCTQCGGSGSVKQSSCCTATCSNCGGCDGYGVENLGEKTIEPIQ